MKDREFSVLAAAKATAALVVAGLLGLIAASSLRAQAAPEGTNSPVGQTASASLDYREANSSFVSWSLRLDVRASAFKKEPAFSGGKISRGTLQLGGGRSNEVAFAWDRKARKIYLDLNRNQDLTDDPSGVYACQAGLPDSVQTFAKVQLPFPTPLGNRPTLADLTFYDYGQPNVTAAMRSFWQGKVTLQGEEWQVGLVGNPPDQRSSLESGHLLLRLWAERNQPFNLYGGSLETVPYSQKLFVGNHAYQVQFSNEGQGDAAKARVQFTEQESSLGELKITGEFIQRLTLEGGPYLVVIDKPGSVVKVPVGSYGQAKFSLKKGGVEAHLERATQFEAGRITVNDKRPAVLVAGGPLTNSVSISRQGKNLLLNYQVLGAGGVYQLDNQDRSHPPEFTVYQGDKKIASGKFEFG